MKKWSSLVLIFVGISLSLMAFNNCSDTSFSDSGDVGNSVGSGDGANDAQGNGDANGDGSDANSDNSIGGMAERDLTNEELDQVYNNIPPEDLANPRPVTDLQEDPSLYDVYACPNNNGVVVCHFPNNVESHATKCIGRSAVTSHYTHYRIYYVDDEERAMGDYLGPCRIPL